MALPPITYRITKGAPLTHQEGDDNIRNLDERVSAAVVTVATIAPVAGNVPTAALRTALTVPSAPSDIGAATAAQGALAATAVQPAALAAGLDGKVDKEAGYGLSQTNFTQAEKDKLAGLEGSHYRGTFVTFSALESGVASPVAGDYADVDGGVGADVLRYIWDDTDGEWVAQSGSASPITAAEVKSLYESNPDTNAFSDAEKTKLSGVAVGATANATNAELRDRATHTGTQLASTISNFSEAARDTILDGLLVVPGSPVVSTDTILAALGKLQGQINASEGGMWALRAIGEPFPIWDHIAGVPTPPTDNEAYRYIKLTASDSYNAGVLISESVSGSAPLVQATAVVSLAGSPMDGQTVRLINTERRLLRPGQSGAVEADAFQGHAVPMYVSGGNNVNPAVANNADGETVSGATISGVTTNQTRPQIISKDLRSDGTNGTPRTANETRPKNIGATYYMRIR